MTQTPLFQTVAATALLAGGLALTGPAAAQTSYPDEPINIVVAWPAGGSHDLIGRVVGEELSEIMGVPVVVNNVTGASGTTGMRFLTEAPADGYTIGVLGMHAIAQAFMNPNAPGVETFDPIVYVNDDPGALQIHSSTGIETVEDYVAAVRDDPSAFLNGTDPQGGNTFVFANVIRQELDVPMMMLPYQGHAPTVTALITEEIQTAALPLPPILEHARAGTVNVLAVASPERHPLLPDVPTFQEQGFDIVVNDFVMIAAPQGMPEDVRGALEEGLLAAVTSDAFTEVANSRGMVLRQGGADAAGAEFTRQIDVVYPLLESDNLVHPDLVRD